MKLAAPLAPKMCDYGRGRNGLRHSSPGYGVKYEIVKKLKLKCTCYKLQFYLKTLASMLINY